MSVDIFLPLPEDRLLLLVLSIPFLGTDRCMIRMGIPPKSKSSFKDLDRNLRSVSESCAFPLTKATKVGGRAFTWVKYLILGCEAWSFQECLPITWPNRKETFTTTSLTVCRVQRGNKRPWLLTLRNQRLRRAVDNLTHHFSYVSITWRMTAIRPLPSNAEINTTGIPVTC